MTFAASVSQVRDTTLPAHRRVVALRDCVYRYRPLGFVTTLSFLAVEAGPFHRNEAALQKAADLIETSRDRWLVEVRDYAAARRAAKRLGHRCPRQSELNPYDPRCWHAAPARGAMHALSRWTWLPALLAQPGPPNRDIAACVAAFTESGGYLSEVQDRILDVHLRRLSYSGYPGSVELIQVALLLRASARVTESVLAEHRPGALP